MAKRKPNYPIAPYLLRRWSPRSMTGEAIEERELMQLFEAARWAPSSFNEQPWFYLYARRETPQFDLFYSLLGDFNKSWVKNAAYLLVVLSRKTFKKTREYSPTHSFDTGSSWENLALQASKMKIVAHGMSGFDYTKAYSLLNVPEDFQVEAMIAIGKKASKKMLPKELRIKEKISDREPITNFIREGAFEPKTVSL